MRGYHEQREAENLLMLLNRSRDMLRRFNQPDAEILAAAGLPARCSAAQKEDARLRWYLNLALEMEQYRRTGLFALCFSDAKRARRHPYELLARLPLQAEETEKAEIQAELLTGLEPEQAEIVRRKYARLLRILPMRELFERLSKLAAPLQGRKLAQQEVLRGTLLGIMHAKGWRSAICEQGEYGKQSLDIADNDFTIIDRLIEMHDKPLSARPQVMIPQALLERSESPAVHIAAAVAVATMHDAALSEDVRLTDYAPCEGGHIALGLYGDGAPGTLFNALQADQRRQTAHRRIIHTRRYCRYQLMRFDAGEVRWLRQKLEGAASEEEQLPSVVLPAAEECTGWYEAVQAIHALDWDAAPEATIAEELLYLPDNGGNGAFRALQTHLKEKRQTRREEQLQEQRSDEELLRSFLNGEDMLDKFQLRALAALKQTLSAFFADTEQVEAPNGTTISPVQKLGKHCVQNIGMLVLAYLCREEAKALAAKKAETPTEVETLLKQMKTDEAVRNAFREFSRRPDVNGLQRVLFVRYISGENGSQILLSQSPCIRKDSLNAWFASTGEGGSFDADAFREYCKRGLMRHAFRRKSVAASPALFQLAPSKQFAAEDKAFHLVLMHYLLSRGSDGCLLIVPGTDAASARLLSAGKTEQKVMTICEEVGSMTPAERQELLQTATARCLTVLTASEPGQADSVQLLPASADKSAKKAAAKKKKEDAAR